MPTCKWQRQGLPADTGKERETGMAAGRLQFGAVSRHVPLVLSFAGATRSLGGPKQHANKQPEKVRRVRAASVSNSKILYGNLVERLPSVLQAPCGLPRELDEPLG